MVVYHLHSDNSMFDCATDFADYIALAKEQGMTAIGSSEHGIHRDWVRKKLLCEEAGLKFLNGVEIYLTESLEEKVRDNYHTILIAKNHDGLVELNRAVYNSTKPDHMFYNNRLTFDEFLALSNNIIKISACIASPLCRLPHDHPYYNRLVEAYDFLEIQHHNIPQQKEYNSWLWQLSCEYGKPLIAGTDTHAATKYKADCRQIMLDYKKQRYDGEDEMDLTWITEQDLVAAYARQGVLPQVVYLEAIANTNKLADMVEDEPLDRSIKCPILYGSSAKDEEVFESRIHEMFAAKLRDGVIPMSQKEAYEQAIQEELRVFKKLHMCGFMLSQSELVSWCHNHDVPTGPSRGSVGGSRIAYITDIIDMNPESLNTFFSRFMNETRVEPPDIDTDIITEDRPKIFEYIASRFGSEFTARVGSYGTYSDKNIIIDVGAALANNWLRDHGEDDRELSPYPLKRVDRIKKEYDSDPDATAKKYPDIFYYYEGLKNVRKQQGVHPAGMVISPVNLIDEYGVMYKDGENVLIHDMDAVHDAGLVKYDFLGLKTIAVIRDTCKLAGIPYPRYHTMDWDDQKVWKDICDFPQAIFQMESQFAADAIKTFQAKSIADMTLVTACIRPSGESYRDKVFAHIANKNPTKEMDNLFANSLGYLVYQEQIIEALIKLCGFSGSEADTVRRDIAKKKEDKVAADVIKIREGYCARSDKPREVAEKECEEMLQVINDASGYSFGYNHAAGYSLIGYICGWLRYYYPTEFVAAWMNNADGKDDLATGTALMRRYNVRVMPPKFGVSKSGFGCDHEKHECAIGLISIDGFGSTQGDALYKLAHEHEYKSFVDLLDDIFETRALNATQVQQLIDIDFFSMFGNINELTSIYEFYNMLGNRKTLNKEKYANTPIQCIIQQNANGLTAKGAEAKVWTITNRHQLLLDIEEYVRRQKLDDLSTISKAIVYAKIMNGECPVTGREEDRPKLYVKSVYPVKRKKDNKQFGVAITTRSLGSGIESRFTIFMNVYNQDPVEAGDFVFVRRYSADTKGDTTYFTLWEYDKLYPGD